MHKLIYIDGQLADALGRVNLQMIADRIAFTVQQPVDLMTHGDSEFHGDRRFTGRPPATSRRPTCENQP
jgi:hypothetical protein